MNQSNIISAYVLYVLHCFNVTILNYNIKFGNQFRSCRVTLNIWPVRDYRIISVPLISLDGPNFSKIMSTEVRFLYPSQQTALLPHHL